MMKREYKYFAAILSIFFLSMLVILLLLRKYSLLTFQHFVDTCRQVLPTFFSSGVHFVGLALVALTLLIAIIFCVKTLFSLIKTQRKIDSLLKYRLEVFPGKLHRVLEKVELHRDRVVLVDMDTNHAFNYGLVSRKIVLSKGLVDRLNSKQLEAVVLHEMYHLKNIHSLLLVLSEIAASTVFFLPLVKEINKRMRVICEKQADTFAENIQGSGSHLKTALLKVPSSRIEFYPGFAMRRQHEVSRKNVFSSVFVVFVLVSLLLFPVSTHATETTVRLIGGECTESQCSTHCPTDNMSSEPNMSLSLQTNLVSTSTIY